MCNFEYVTSWWSARHNWGKLIVYVTIKSLLCCSNNPKNGSLFVTANSGNCHHTAKKEYKANGEG